MFCPRCGRDNSINLKFCASCGTNLEAVSQALTGSDDDFFTKIDNSLDHFLGRYAEHVFRSAPTHAAEQTVGKSWQVLGQSIVTSFVDLILFSLMWNVIPLRFLILLISTPIRLLSAQKHRKGVMSAGNKPVDLSDPMPQHWLPESIVSVTEHTTMILADSERAQEKPVRKPPQK